MSDTMEVSCRCPLCGNRSIITCKSSEYSAYLLGALVQEAFPNLKLNERETLISGLCDECQEKYMSDDGDDCDGDCENCMDFLCPGKTYEETTAE